MKKRGTRGEGEGAQKKKKKKTINQMTKEEDKKQGVVEDRGKIRKKKKNFDSVIEPITIVKTKTRGGKHTFFGGTLHEFTNARGVYIKGADQNVRAISLPQRRVCLLFLYFFVDEQEADREEQHRTTPKFSDDDDDDDDDEEDYQSSGCLVCF